MTSKAIIYTAAILIFGICTYLFLDGNGVFKGELRSDAFAWYFFAKGIFCSLSLVLTRALLEAIGALRQSASAVPPTFFPERHVRTDKSKRVYREPGTPADGPSSSS
jgi:hypothetical protein